MKKPLFTILLVIFAITSCLNFVSAENETDILRNSESEEEVLATKDGHLNITFDNGYNGYCIEYGEHEAKIGQEYSVENTSHAINKNTGESVGNYLKVYFVDYYEDAMRDDIVTQHTIWHFTDDFNGWRIDPLLIENIRAAAATKTIPDSGAVRQINNTTEAVFDFQVLSSAESDNQNFFAYKITYRDIIKDIIGNSTISNDTSKEEHENVTNSTENSTISEQQKNVTDSGEDNPLPTAKDTQNLSDKHDQKSDPENEDSENVSKTVKLSKHTTGKRGIGVLLLLIVLGIIAVKYIRRD
ncbi:MAG: hypothetical protein IKF13_01400 [Methanobrevibacter sp.]|nr:hypothetical protein [Methanobrevibacter sp.]